MSATENLTGHEHEFLEKLLELHGQQGAAVLSARLQYDHLGARNASGNLVFLPDVGDLSRNVVIHSANASGTRGYTLFTGHANLDSQ